MHSRHDHGHHAHHGHSSNGKSRVDDGSLDLSRHKASVFSILEKIEAQLEQRTREIEHERKELHRRREEEQIKKEELITLKAELETAFAQQQVANMGIFGCCYSPASEQRAFEIEARKERRMQIAQYAAEAFEEADENDDRELTVEELRQIEGDNAEKVMREADVNGDGVLSKKEYVNYKLWVAKQAGKAARKAFKAADFNGDKELTLEELREIEGDNADRVMREADVDNSGALSKREYVDYKIRCAAHNLNNLR